MVATTHHTSSCSRDAGRSGSLHHLWVSIPACPSNGRDERQVDGCLSEMGVAPEPYAAAAWPCFFETWLADMPGRDLGWIPVAQATRPATAVRRRVSRLGQLQSSSEVFWALCVYMCICMCMYIYIYIFIYLFICTCKYMYLYIYIYAFLGIIRGMTSRRSAYKFRNERSL